MMDHFVDVLFENVFPDLLVIKSGAPELYNWYPVSSDPSTIPLLSISVVRVIDVDV